MSRRIYYRFSSVKMRFCAPRPAIGQSGHSPLACRIGSFLRAEGGRRACSDHGGAMCAQCCASVTPGCAPYPGAERENMWHVDRKSPLQWEKRGAFNEKYASSCTKRPVFRIFFPVGRPQGSCFAVRWGVPSFRRGLDANEGGERGKPSTAKNPLCKGEGALQRGSIRNVLPDGQR